MSEVLMDPFINDSTVREIGTAGRAYTLVLEELASLEREVRTVAIAFNSVAAFLANPLEVRASPADVDRLASVPVARLGELSKRITQKLERKAELREKLRSYNLPVE